MTTKVRRFEDRDIDAIERLNRRLEDASNEHRLYREDLSRNPNADLNVRPINDALFVAAEGEEIRGGAWLREQYFWVDGAQHRVGWMKYPVSESLIDKQHAGVPASMVLQFLRLQPFLMAFGMGGHDAPFSRLLKGIGWQASTVPFFFRISRPFRVLRGLSHLRRRRMLRWAMDAAAWSGLGWLANTLFRATSRSGNVAGVTWEIEEGFAPWADDVWLKCSEAYPAVAVRDATTLDFLYPPSLQNVQRLRVTRGQSNIGWVCAQMLPQSTTASEYFGRLRVGVITDVLALPQDASMVLDAGVRHLEASGVDLVITYLSHVAWVSAARRLRFLPGPSTLAFYRSPQAERLLVQGSLGTRCHLTRSDCHGPIQ